MLQRIQTVYLFLALAAIGISLGLDWVVYLFPGSSISFMAENALVMQLTVGVSILTILAVIFRFKDRKAQMQLANVAMLEMILILGLFGVLHYMEIERFKAEGALELSYDLASAMPIVGLVLVWMAKKRIKKDDDLVRSVDRLR